MDRKNLRYKVYRNAELSELVPNQTKELETACPFYFGEETTMRDKKNKEIKRFNPVFDMMANDVWENVT